MRTEWEIWVFQVGGQLSVVGSANLGAPQVHGPLQMRLQGRSFLLVGRVVIIPGGNSGWVEAHIEESQAASACSDLVLCNQRRDKNNRVM